jgi:hypothetical protein
MFGKSNKAGRRRVRVGVEGLEARQMLYGAVAGQIIQAAGLDSNPPGGAPTAPEVQAPPQAPQGPIEIHVPITTMDPQPPSPGPTGGGLPTSKSPYLINPENLFNSKANRGKALVGAFTAQQAAYWQSQGYTVQSTLPGVTPNDPPAGGGGYVTAPQRQPGLLVTTIMQAEQEFEQGFPNPQGAMRLAEQDYILKLVTKVRDDDYNRHYQADMAQALSAYEAVHGAPTTSLALSQIEYSLGIEVAVQAGAQNRYDMIPTADGFSTVIVLPPAVPTQPKQPWYESIGFNKLLPSHKSVQESPWEKFIFDAIALVPAVVTGVGAIMADVSAEVGAEEAAEIVREIAQIAANSK